MPDAGPPMEKTHDDDHDDPERRLAARPQDQRQPADQAQRLATISASAPRMAGGGRLSMGRESGCRRGHRRPAATAAMTPGRAGSPDPGSGTGIPRARQTPSARPSSRGGSRSRAGRPAAARRALTSRSTGGHRPGPSLRLRLPVRRGTRPGAAAAARRPATGRRRWRTSGPSRGRLSMKVSGTVATTLPAMPTRLVSVDHHRVAPGREPAGDQPQHGDVGHRVAAAQQAARQQGQRVALHLGEQQLRRPHDQRSRPAASGGARTGRPECRSAPAWRRRRPSCSMTKVLS